MFDLDLMSRWDEALGRLSGGCAVTTPRSQKESRFPEASSPREQARESGATA